MIQIFALNVIQMQEKIVMNLKRDDCLQQTIEGMKREIEKNTDV
jgi:hypothetical protein